MAGLDLLLHRGTRWLALVGLVIGAVIVPPEGLGRSTCGMVRVAGLPCPTCGMTRSVSSILHGEFVAAWQYHPMGYLVAAAFVLLGPLALIPTRWISNLKNRLAPLGFPLFVTLMVWAVLVLGYGGWRIGAVLRGNEDLAWWREGAPAPALASRPGGFPTLYEDGAEPAPSP